VANAIAHADALNEVHVDAGVFTHLSITFDSGIR
jgi:hypothetical protein